MIHLDALHVVVRTRVSSGGRTEPLDGTSSTHDLSQTEQRALAAWQRHFGRNDGHRPMPAVGSEEWGAPPAPGR